MALPDRIVVDSKILTGKAVIRGTRVAVEFIDLLAVGWSYQQILASCTSRHRILQVQPIDACLYRPLHIRRLQFLWKLDFAGAGPGLQNRSAAYFCVAGGFDSH